MTRALSMLARLVRDQAMEIGRSLGRDDGGLER